MTPTYKKLRNICNTVYSGYYITYTSSKSIDNLMVMINIKVRTECISETRRASHEIFNIFVMFYN
jgi:hypothetical protein